MIMEEIMQSNSFFILPLTLAYASICGMWFLLNRKGRTWSILSIDTPESPRTELILGLLACVGILIMGQLYSAGYLIPKMHQAFIDKAIVWPLNNVLIFSPIVLVLLIRKQSLKTIFISGNDVMLKVGFGLVASLMGILIFVGMRGEWSRLSEIGVKALELDALSNFPAVFFENVAVAFLFVRMKWSFGIRWAIGVPAILFAIAHIPGSVAEGDSWSHILTFFFLTGGLTTMILYTAYRGRDIIWLGIVHYMMDIVIKAF